MFRIESRVKTNSPEFIENMKHNKELVKQLRERLEQV